MPLLLSRQWAAREGGSARSPIEVILKSANEEQKRHIRVVILLLFAYAVFFRVQLRGVVVAGLQTLKGKETTRERVVQYSEVVHARLTPFFARAGVAYPPRAVTLVGLKDEQKLEVWVGDEKAAWKHLRDYSILGMSGRQDGIGGRCQKMAG